MIDWPTDDEMPFKLDRDVRNNACIDPYHITLTRYGENYKDAADALITAALSGEVYVDVVVYPSVFLYRQYVELVLKDLTWSARRLENAAESFSQTHRIDVLWNDCKQALKQHYGDEYPEQLRHLDTFMDQFVEHDPNSMAFRYPFDKSGNRHLLGLSHVNLRHLKEVMSRVDALLTGLSDHLSDRLDAVSEMRREMRRDSGY